MSIEKNDYLRFALKHNAFIYKHWHLSVFGIFTPQPREDMYVGMLVEYDDDIYYIDEQGSRQGPVLGFKNDQPLFTPNDIVTLSKGDLANVTVSIESTVGRTLANAMLLAYPFQDTFDFINEEVKAGKIGDQIAIALKDDVITAEQVSVYFKQLYFMSSLTSLWVPSASEKSITTSPAIVKRRDQLLKQHKDELDNPAVIAKIEKELIDMDREYIKDDPSAGFYKSAKAFNVTRKQAYIMHGGEASFEDPSKIEVIPRSLQDGWNVDDLPALINSLRDGSYARSTQTALGGEAVKTITRVFQNSFISQDDCKDKVGMPMIITELNYRSFIGRHLVSSPDKSLTEAELKNSIGKTLVLRSPMSCKVPFTDYCKVCMGDAIADNDKALSLLASATGSAFLSLFLKRFHASNIETEVLQGTDFIQ